MPDRERDGRGVYTDKVTTDRILGVFDRDCPPDSDTLLTRHVHNGLETHFRVDVTRQTVRRRLDALEGEGVLTSQGRGKGSTDVFWTLVDANKAEK